MSTNNLTINNNSSNETLYLIIDYGNFTNISYHKCEIKQTFVNARAFFYCYNYFYEKMWLASTFQFLIVIGTIFFNSLVMILMIENSERISKFDQIIFGHSMVNINNIIEIFC